MKIPRILSYGTAVIALAAVGFYLALPRLTSFSGRSAAYAAIEDRLEDDAQRGIAYFAFGDFSSLSTDALRVSATPWKLSTAALALDAVKGDVTRVGSVDIAAIFRRFGFHSPTSFGNWPEGMPKPEFLSPVGQNVGFGGRAFPPIGATIANIGCAACHSSVMYRDDGTPDTTRVWLGMPNGSINLEAYSSTLFNAMVAYGDDSDRMMDAVARLYPDTGWRERWTLRFFILPELQKTIAERNAAIGRFLPFRASLAGATNGLDSLKNRLGMIPMDKMLTESIFNSVPDLGGRLWRNKLLNSGTYAIPGIDHTKATRREDIDAMHRRGLAGIIAYFTVPSMGVSNEVAETSIDPAFWITSWMDTYKPQPFPGHVDATLLPQGRAIYAEKCASCHGSYDDSLQTPGLVSFPNWEGDIGTDPQRARLLTKEIADAVNASLFGRYIAARTVKTYTAPPLTGVWASGPYFHNGSVPTLWHLMHPKERPVRFQVGGHKLDLVKVGLAGEPDGAGHWNPPTDYKPWSEPAIVDSKAFGLGNGGHEAEFAPLSEPDKSALLEYLKLL